MFSAATKSAHPAGGATYVEDVFSTYLYTGNGSTQTIVNGLDLSTKGGMVWTKSRTYGDNGGTPGDHVLWDSSVQSPLNSNTTNAAANSNATSTSGGVNSFTSTGFVSKSAFSGANYCTWSFRKQPKFFDVVTYTGDGVAGRAIAHNLGSAPGMIIVKCTSSVTNWPVYHRGIANSYLTLNSTDGNSAATAKYYWGDDTTVITPTSTNFTVGGSTVGYSVNGAGQTYVAYLFANNAGGFGLTGTDNVITCGSFTADGSGNATINLGYEPQWVIVKCSSNGSTQWLMLDTMRGWPTDGNVQELDANLFSAESYTSGIYPRATGFITSGGNFTNKTFIYMAIRRPMKVPTDATTVFSPNVATLTGSANTVTTNFPVDLAIPFYRQGFYANWFDRLRGDSQSNGVRLRSASTAEEVVTPAGLGFDNNTGYVDNYDRTYVSGTGNYVYWNFSRRPGFFDEVCYTGDGTYGNKNHNLTVAPELIISKARNSTGDWYTWLPSLNTSSNPDTGYLNSTAAFFNYFSGGTIATSTTFVPAEDTASTTYVAYLFATCSGVSKVGSYTGNGTTQAISCGFTGGARFVMIKRTDSTSDWFVYDTARGMTTLVDPYLPMNGVTETATLGSVTTTAGGFTVNASVLAAINVSGGSYIFLAIA